MNLSNLVINDKEVIVLDDVLLTEEIRSELSQLIKEHIHIEELSQYGLPVNNKVLLYGSSGCGKTMTAKALANVLNKNIIILNLSNIVCSRIGETSQNIKQIFDKAGREKAVLFLDEFDQIGKARGKDDKDVGEIRRLVNTLIQLIDYYPDKALLVCATNHAEIIDGALLRRFQLRINFEMPDAKLLDKYYDRLLSAFPIEFHTIERQYDLSFAEAKDYVFTLMKSILIKQFEKRK